MVVAAAGCVGVVRFSDQHVHHHYQRCHVLSGGALLKELP
jgi:hypothetical protein